MTKPSDITDPGYRNAMETADRQLDDGDYLGAVRTCADTYVDLVGRRPDILQPDAPRRPSVWPGLGIKLETGSDAPRISCGNANASPCRGRHVL
jgi:hypothetical protein